MGHDDTLAGSRSEQLEEENDMSGSGNKIDIALTAELRGSAVLISGPPGPFSVGKDTGACGFDFTLTDNTGANVKFDSLDTADNIAGCPPTGSGDQSTQIGGVAKNNNVSPKKAGFTDNNNNDAKNGSMNVSFQWNFTCDDASKSVQPYDPIIANGGKTLA
jgi:hypothetical protein